MNGGARREPSRGAAIESRSLREVASVPEFSPPVRVALGKAGNVTHVVTSAEKAADVLLNRWPTEGGRKHLAARKAVLRALEAARDAKAASDARKAFAAAASEAGILMPEPPRSVAPAGLKSPDWNRPKRKLKRES